jgi:alcohol dehydrogenase, propanol-preferring
MHAMILEAPRTTLQLQEIPQPVPTSNQLLLKVHTCGICRTDLHIIDGELDRPNLPLILGHQIVGTIQQLPQASTSLQIGQRVGVPWLGRTCQHCFYCQHGQENLCDQAQFTGYNLNGGYADYAIADPQFCFPIPDGYPDEQAAPLLCAGLIGYRAYRMTESAEKLGFYGFGAAAHILIQLARYQGRQVYAFTKPGDTAGQAFARELGAVWAGGSDEVPPVALDAAIIFAAVGALVPTALSQLSKGGVVVCAGIHMSEIPAFPYEILWGERVIRSVANLTRQDGEEFLTVAPQVPIQTHVHRFPLTEANTAIAALRSGAIQGAAVLQVNQGS